MYARIHISTERGEPVRTLYASGPLHLETLREQLSQDSQTAMFAIEYVGGLSTVSPPNVGASAPHHVTADIDRMLRAGFRAAAADYALRSSSAILEARGRMRSREYLALLALQSRPWGFHE